MNNYEQGYQNDISWYQKNLQQQYIKPVDYMAYEEMRRKYDEGKREKEIQKVGDIGVPTY